MPKRLTSAAYSPGLRRAAGVVSTLGHPLGTAMLFVGFAAFRLLDGPAALAAVVLVAGGVVGPVAAWNYRQVRRGHYANFDVSVREQRRSFYPRLLGLLLLVVGLMWGLEAARPLRAGLLAALGLLTLCYLLNFRLKVSLHAALSFFLAGCLGLLAGSGAGAVALLLAALVAASRLVLGRHTVPELLAGTGLGLGAAAALLAWTIWA
ncbi:hypothetical protein LJ737_25215 [Hymenobacter sp. 15J16-1T3B]|uniref:phosphatase PAP2 family protein n=1 Tax=Hymenobacter sp. 15J16-1T3B TaxID=2886941 RepID=UPI001D105D53|nr:hypothetical protein [Hymenobacter sp. 15J16-1T3B]MCC3160562.1 hypothetical protein [Hymenobacter sp. 15J16-1T3B]